MLNGLSMRHHALRYEGVMSVRILPAPAISSSRSWRPPAETLMFRLLSADRSFVRSVPVGTRSSTCLTCAANGAFRSGLLMSLAERDVGLQSTTSVLPSSISKGMPMLRPPAPTDAESVGPCTQNVGCASMSPGLLIAAAFREATREMDMNGSSSGSIHVTGSAACTALVTTSPRQYG